MSGDRYLSWISTGIVLAALVLALFGYIFLSLLVMLWWLFQLACVESVVAIYYQLSHYRRERLQGRVEAYRKRITFVTGVDKDKLLFPATWFYDLLSSVLLPIFVVMSIPLCLKLSLEIFDFSDLYGHLFRASFFNLTDSSGQEILRISFYNIVLTICLFFAFRYASHALGWVYRRSSYASFLRKNDRKFVRSNEINLSLGNSVVNILVWFVYIVFLVILLKIPTNSLTLVAGGLSAGIGLALKDILNNFIYGIQLMGGRLRVGDWIDCDGVRGKVVDINYQTTLVETIDSTQVAFLNSSLFAKSFTNLTRNSAYEVTVIRVGVAYGTDFQKLRDALEKGLEALKTKDAFGRDVIDPNYGIRIRFDNFGDSSVDVAVKQQVLVPEQIEFRYRCRELIYKILAENGFTIPFPQRDVHMIDDNK